MSSISKSGVGNSLPPEISDPFRWLEEDAQTPKVAAWIDTQSQASESYFKKLHQRDSILDELKKLFHRESVDVPTPRQGKYFYQKRKPDEDMAVLYVKDGINGAPRVLIDPNTLSDDHTLILEDWEPSRDGKLLMYELSSSGNDMSEIRVMNVESGEKYPEVIPDDLYPQMCVWDHAGAGFWYVRRAPNAPKFEAKFHRRLYFHRLGTPVSDDELVWGEGLDRESTLWARLSADGRYFLISVHGQETGKEWMENYLRDLSKPGSEYVQVTPRILDSLFYAHIHRDKLYVTTNHEAPRWKMAAKSIEEALAGTGEFVDLIPESEDIFEGYCAVGDYLFAKHLHNVHARLSQYSLDGTFVRDIPLPVPGSVGGFSKEAEGDEFFFCFGSYAYPPTIYRLDLKTNETVVVEQLETTFDTDLIATEQVWYPSKDGTRIPMFLVHRKDLVLDGGNPAYLYGYGGFEISLTPSFMTLTIPFIMEGGVLAIANLRGGGEFGKEWHEAGMKKNKQNVFDDFIAAAEFLVREGYTNHDRIAVGGGSNGGLLVAALMVQRPDLVRAVLCNVPVTDMLRFHLHHGGRHWIPEYGDPDDPDMASYLQGYSPYHNLKDGERYPATLIMTSDGDDRVHPLHAYKFAARLQEANASEHPILVRVERKAGHSGASAISRLVEEEADKWAFIYDQLGIA